MTDFYYDAELIDSPAVVELADSETDVIEVSTSESMIVEVATGPFGPSGRDGSSFVVGEGSPTSNIGANGDIYIESNTGNFYGPKVDDEWPAEPFYYNLNQRFIFTQSSPSSVWNVTHTLGGKPSVTVVDSASTQVIGEVEYLSNTQVRVNFSHPFSGQAYLT